MNVALLWPLHALLILGVEGEIDLDCLEHKILNVRMKREGFHTIDTKAFSSVSNFTYPAETDW